MSDDFLSLTNHASELVVDAFKHKHGFPESELNSLFDSLDEEHKRVFAIGLVKILIQKNHISLEQWLLDKNILETSFANIIFHWYPETVIKHSKEIKDKIQGFSLDYWIEISMIDNFRTEEGISAYYKFINENMNLLSESCLEETRQYANEFWKSIGSEERWSE